MTKLSTHAMDVSGLAPMRGQWEQNHCAHQAGVTLSSPYTASLLTCSVQAVDRTMDIRLLDSGQTKRRPGFRVQSAGLLIPVMTDKSVRDCKVITRFCHSRHVMSRRVAIGQNVIGERGRIRRGFLASAIASATFKQVLTATGR